VKGKDYKYYYQEIIKLLEGGGYELLKITTWYRIYQKGDWIFMLRKKGFMSPEVFCYKNYMYKGFIFYGNIDETYQEIAEKLFKKIENIENETGIQKERTYSKRGRRSSI